MIFDWPVGGGLIADILFLGGLIKHLIIRYLIAFHPHSLYTSYIT